MMRIRILTVGGRGVEEGSCANDYKNRRGGKIFDCTGACKRDSRVLEPKARRIYDFSFMAPRDFYCLGAGDPFCGGMNGVYRRLPNNIAYISDGEGESHTSTYFMFPYPKVINFTLLQNTSPNISDPSFFKKLE